MFDKMKSPVYLHDIEIGISNGQKLSSKDKEMINKDLDQMLYFGQFFVY